MPAQNIYNNCLKISLFRADSDFKPISLPIHASRCKGLMIRWWDTLHDHPNVLNLEDVNKIWMMKKDFPSKWASSCVFSFVSENQLWVWIIIQSLKIEFENQLWVWILIQSLNFASENQLWVWKCWFKVRILHLKISFESENISSKSEFWVWESV